MSHRCTVRARRNAVRLGLAAVILTSAGMFLTAGPAAAQDPNMMNIPIVSVSLNPSETTLQVGEQQSLMVQAILDSGAAHLAGGGVPIWSIVTEPGMNVSDCGTGVTLFNSQNFTLDGTGAFHEVWSPSTPDTLKADGSMTLPTATTGASLSASLQCVNGAATGSFAGFWQQTQYDGTFAFAGGSGAIAVVGLTWTSSNPAVAAVDHGGNVTALSEGDVTITATYGSRCWRSEPSATHCRGTTSGEAIVHVRPSSGGGEGCALITFTLLPGSEPFTQVQVTLVDPQSGNDLDMFTATIGAPLSVPEGSYHFRFSAPGGYAVTPVQRGLNMMCGDDTAVRLRFR